MFSKTIPRSFANVQETSSSCSDLSYLANPTTRATRASSLTTPWRMRALSTQNVRCDQSECQPRSMPPQAMVNWRHTPPYQCKPPQAMVDWRRNPPQMASSMLPVSLCSRSYRPVWALSMIENQSWWTLLTVKTKNSTTMMTIWMGKFEIRPSALTAIAMPSCVMAPPRVTIRTKRCRMRKAPRRQPQASTTTPPRPISHCFGTAV